MRVLIASDSFGSSMNAPQACGAIAAGWHASAPHDEVVLLPLSDGGPGFLSCLSARKESKLSTIFVRSPLGGDVEAELVRIGSTVYIESAQACGRALIDDRESIGVREGTTFGVGQLLLAALGVPGVTRIVVGLGGSGTNDGGAGMLAALGAVPSLEMSHGGVGLINLSIVNLDKVRNSVVGVELVIATDVDNPLLGPTGATTVYAPQKGAKASDVTDLESALAHFASVTNMALANTAGSGAAGGLAFGFMLLGARRVSGIEMMARAVGLPQAIAASDLVVTGEGSFDWQSLRGKVIAGVAHFAARSGKPVVVIAGQVHCARREFMALGVESAYAVAETEGEIAASMADPEGKLTTRAASVAQTWSPKP
jgi:glycerate kinase